jgi:hypothetical protein
LPLSLKDKDKLDDTYNLEGNLSIKSSEMFETFKAGKYRGRFFLILMINHILSNTEEVASSLNERVKKFKYVQGKNIYQGVSLL